MHGASRSQAMRLIIPILGPAIWSALAIGFAESIGDFGVAATLAHTANFPLATYQLYAAIGNLPPNFPLAAGMGWLLVVSRPIVTAWLFTFCGVFLELPLSQLLYAPGSIAIEDNLSNYHFGVGMAQAVLAVAVALAAAGAVPGRYRLLAPAGWRRIGSTAGVRDG